MNIIETENLTRRYGKNDAVNGLTFHVPEGAIYAFLGPNGAGKTTTIQTLLNIQRPTSGIARVLGVPTTALGPKELAQIGYVSENQQLPESMTVDRFLAWCKPMYPTWDDAFADQLRARFELPLDRKLKNLSRGMKMKAALLASIAYRPRLLVLDEPFSGLDPLMRDEFIRGVLELSEQEKWTVFLSSHDIDEVERLADWVGILNMGKLHLSEASESLQRRFRRVEFTVKEENRKLPASLPASWYVAEVAGHGVRFVTGEYVAGETEKKVAEIFPDASPVTVSPMPLREIFLALARTFRIKPTL
ncbi:ABC-2 type transport system ATP-binding protein [Verrucomicrobium sp. GAS474]|uniref:ABC transporter ATP-binding protein n=1 Tax=Verrucomicrobium sp. GAS474 TaxID=1882831 RepID=UPI00087BFA59|nr:ABC transporter ATP-binding protein [Verrucomicrobium sp. GAS474]SDU08382.1 ABC-2 type transport system ATP-binding protein [Verrucomicrobium sp. GAS474]